MIEGRYVVRSRADRGVDDQAHYYAIESTPEVAHRFLVAAHDTFAPLATQPNMGSQARLRKPELASLRVFSGNRLRIQPYVG